jgi:NAD(P)-dependent dehydrogenase (short-subunit alcohol dehydrogenase family)
MEGKVAIVTGGSSGIGASMVEMFVAEGARVMIAARGEEAGQMLAEKLGQNAAFIRTDVTVEDDVKAMVDAAHERWGRLDCLCNNACRGIPGFEIEDFDAEAFPSYMMLILGSVFLGMKYAVPIMKKQHSGSIINIASTAGVTYDGSGTIYSGGKAALIHLTTLWALDLARYGIRVNSISPGGIITPIFWGGHQSKSPEESQLLSERLAAHYATNTPLGRAGMPEDIAHPAVFLASDESTYVTGQNIVVEGGRHTLGRSQAEQVERRSARTQALEGKKE